MYKGSSGVIGPGLGSYSYKESSGDVGLRLGSHSYKASSGVIGPGFGRHKSSGVTRDSFITEVIEVAGKVSGNQMFQKC